MGRGRREGDGNKKRHDNFCEQGSTCARYPAERVRIFLLELRIPVRIPERISVRISQVRCSVLEGSNFVMENPSQNSQQNPQQNSHGRVGEIFTDFFCRVGSIRSTPTPWARGLQDQIQKWVLQTQKTLYF